MVKVNYNMLDQCEKVQTCKGLCVYKRRCSFLVLVIKKVSVCVVENVCGSCTGGKHKCEQLQNWNIAVCVSISSKSHPDDTVRPLSHGDS
jgi:hypothetical protein